MAKTATKGKAQVRIAQDLVDWLDAHAEANRDGLTSRALVAEDAIRFYRDHQQEKARRRALEAAAVSAAPGRRVRAAAR
jgi:hypothetical protein